MSSFSVSRERFLIAMVSAVHAGSVCGPCTAPALNPGLPERAQCSRIDGFGLAIRHSGGSQLCHLPGIRHSRRLLWNIKPRICDGVAPLLDVVNQLGMSTTDRRTTQDSLIPGEAGEAAPRDLTGITLEDFRVEKVLGRGGMGEVYLATQVSLNRLVALKVLRPDFASNPTYLGRLKTEATAVAKLNHPNIVHVYTLGCVDDLHFIAMEYVQGTNLRDYILKKGALDLPLAYSIMKQTGQAIGAAGEIGLIHRDVKPENILLTRKGRVKVADFGLCRDQDGQGLHLTQSGVTMGTPLYMSPEQAQGHAVDHRSDLYSLGVTFYHMLAGVPPFRAETALALALKQVRETPRSMLVHRPDLPSELDHLVLKLMEKSPAERFQSAAEMLAELAKLRDVLHIDSAPTITDTGSAAEPASASRAAAASSSLGVAAPMSAKTVLSPRQVRGRRRRRVSRGFPDG